MPTPIALPLRGDNVSTQWIIEQLLDIAQTRGDVTGRAATQLVGAALSIRWSRDAGAEVRDLGVGPSYRIGDTYVHVSPRPASDAMMRLALDARVGQRLILLVPDRRLDQARWNLADAGIADRVSIDAIATWVGALIDRLGLYRASDVRILLLATLTEYNRRLAEHEHAPQLAVELDEIDSMAVQVARHCSVCGEVTAPGAEGSCENCGERLA